MTVSDGTLLPWNPDTAGAAGTWAMARGDGHLFVGGELSWPRTGPLTLQSLLAYPLPLFADGFEQETTGRWSTTVSPD